jgi:hypothetical protein
LPALSYSPGIPVKVLTLLESWGFFVNLKNMMRFVGFVCALSSLDL